MSRSGVTSSAMARLSREKAEHPAGELAAQHERDADRRPQRFSRTSAGGERVTHGRYGRIRSKDTIPPVHDPNPFKGKSPSAPSGWAPSRQ
jgi:hypothetical protein